MRKIKQDFERTQSSQQWFGLLLLAAALAINIGIYVQYNKIVAETLALDQASHKPNQSVVAEKSTKPDEATQQKLYALQQIADKLNVDWAELFKTLEKSRSDQIDLLEVAIEPNGSSIRLSGQAANLQTVLDYVERLKDEKSLITPTLNDHQKVMRENNPIVRFEISAKWQQR